MNNFIRILLLTPDYLTSIRDKVVNLIISFAFRAIKNPFCCLTYFAPIFLLSFALGAFVPIYGIYNAFISTLVCIRRTIDDFAKNY